MGKCTVRLSKFLALSDDKKLTRNIKSLWIPRLLRNSIVANFFFFLKGTIFIKLKKKITLTN